jgi:hypothetical protein
MKIKVDSDLLSATIKTLQRVAQVAQLSVEVTKTDLKIRGTNGGSSCLMFCPCKVTTKSEHRKFSVTAEALATAISKRKEVEITVTESAIEINSARYKVELLTSAYEELEIIPEEVKTNKALKLKTKFIDALRTNLPKIELKPLLALYQYVPIGIKSTDEGTFVACFDSFQSAFYFDPELKGKMEFTLPSNIFLMLAREFKDQAYSISITDSAVYAYNEVFELSVALAQAEGEQVTLEHMLSLYENLKKEKGGVRIKVKTEGINALIENSRAVYDKDSTFTFTTKGNKCKLELKSAYGSMTSMVMLDEEPKKDVSFSCDFMFFSTLLAKAPATLDLRVNDRMMLFTNKPVTYLLSLI